MIEEIKPILDAEGVDSLNIKLTCSGDEMTVIVTAIGDNLPDVLKLPFYMKGEASELDASLPHELCEFAEHTVGLASNLEELKALGKKAVEDAKKGSGSSSSSSSPKKTKKVAPSVAPKLEVIKHELKEKPKEAPKAFDADDLDI